MDERHDIAKAIGMHSRRLLETAKHLGRVQAAFKIHPADDMRTDLLDAETNAMEHLSELAILAEKVAELGDEKP